MCVALDVVSRSTGYGLMRLVGQQLAWGYRGCRYVLDVFRVVLHKFPLCMGGMVGFV